jgi:uncharacterized protein (TIGR02453 family)
MPARPARIAAAATPRFEGFADSRGAFFSALTLHNDRDWFLSHRAGYEAGWRAPMQALLEELRARLAPAYKGLALGPPKIFRIQRDLRFTQEKVPYKTHVGGLVPLAGLEGPMGGTVAAYVQISHADAFAGGGAYAMDPPRLAAHREALLDPKRGAAVGKLVTALEARGFELEAYQTLKRVPAPAPPDHPRAALLRMKGLVAMAPPLPRKLLARRELLELVTEHALAVAPLVRWLAGR